MMRRDRAYLSIVSWPPGLDEARRRDICQKYLGADQFRAREWARRAVPAIFKRDSIEHASRAAGELRDAGVQALATPAALLGPRDGECRDAEWIERRGDGERYVAAFKRGGGGAAAEFSPRQAIALVRAHVREPSRSAGQGESGAASHQMQGTLSAHAWVENRVARAGVSVVEVLEIATREGVRVRIQGGRCGLRGFDQPATPSARAALDALAEQVRRDAANGVDIDTGFESARFVAEFAPDFDVQGDWRSMDGFDVYSNWMYQIARMRADH